MQFVEPFLGDFVGTIMASRLIPLQSNPQRSLALFEYDSLADPAEVSRLRDVLCQVFRLPTSYWESYFARIGHENFRVLRQSNRLVGGLAIYQMGQWFGGQTLGLAGIAAVGIAPEVRSAGAATHLMSSTLTELYRQGVPLSALYPSTQRLYRKVGYEQAGNRYLYQLPLDSIGLRAVRNEVERIDNSGHEQYHELARTRAQRTNGNLERNRGMWERCVSNPYDRKPVYRYLFGSPAYPDGYLFFYQDADKPGPYSLYVRDMMASSPAAARHLWSFLGSHRSMAEKVVWSGPAAEPLLMLTDELEAEVVGHDRWMLRIVDVRKALAQRGYPPTCAAELHFEIQDDIIEANQGRIVLRVSDGVGEVSQGGRGELRTHVRGLSPLFSGLFSPAQLQATGHIEGRDAAITTAASIFAGPEPWMPDMF